MSGPVSVPPIRPMIKSNFGTNSPMQTANATKIERTKHLLKLNSARIIWGRAGYLNFGF